MCVFFKGVVVLVCVRLRLCVGVFVVVCWCVCVGALCVSCGAGVTMWFGLVVRVCVCVVLCGCVLTCESICVPCCVSCVCVCDSVCGCVSVWVMCVGVCVCVCRCVCIGVSAGASTRACSCSRWRARSCSSECALVNSACSRERLFVCGVCVVCGEGDVSVGAGIEGVSCCCGVGRGRWFGTGPAVSLSLSLTSLPSLSSLSSLLPLSPSALLLFLLVALVGGGRRGRVGGGVRRGRIYLSILFCSGTSSRALAFLLFAVIRAFSFSIWCSLLCVLQRARHVSRAARCMVVAILFARDLAFSSEIPLSCRALGRFAGMYPSDPSVLSKDESWLHAGLFSSSGGKRGVAHSYQVGSSAGLPPASDIRLVSFR